MQALVLKTVETLEVRGTLSLAQYQARAARWYAAGADGVHLFNEGGAK